jgi:hypothetical protein
MSRMSIRRGPLSAIRVKRPLRWPATPDAVWSEGCVMRAGWAALREYVTGPASHVVAGNPIAWVCSARDGQGFELATEVGAEASQRTGH